MNIKFLTAVMFSAGLVAGSANAVVVVLTDATTVLQTTALSGFQTLGDDMDGMAVTADFANGASELLFWADTGAGAGGVTGSLFSLNLSGDTFTANWNLLNTNTSDLTKLTIDAGVGDTVFDIFNSPTTGTAGSAFGRQFVEVTAPLAGTITATYSSIVALTGDLPVGDLFAVLMVDFRGLTAGGLTDGLFQFRADTDNLSIAGDLNPNPNPIPLPAALPLFMSALGFFGFMGWRKKRAFAA